MKADKNLSIEDYNKLIADEEQVQLWIIAANKALFAANTAPLKDYDMRYLKHNRLTYDISGAKEADDILLTLSEYKNDIAHLPKHIEGSETTVIEVGTDDYNAWGLEVFDLEYNYYTPYTDDISEVAVAIKHQVNSKIEKALQPSTINFHRHISCGLLDNFKAGKIDWLTMQAIVYNDCKLGDKNV